MKLIEQWLFVLRTALGCKNAVLYRIFDDCYSGNAILNASSVGRAIT